MRLFISICMFFAVCSCEQKANPTPTFKEFEFFYTDTWNTAFALKFTLSDTVLVKQKFVSKRSANVDTLLKSNNAYYALLTQKQKDTLYARLSEPVFTDYDSVYAAHVVDDGRMMHFHVTTVSTVKNIRVTENNGPAELWELSTWLIDLKRQMHWMKLDSMQACYWREPELIIDTSKFVPPSD